MTEPLLPPEPLLGHLPDLDGSPTPLRDDSAVSQDQPVQQEAFPLPSTDPGAPPAPEPVPRLLPSEFAGIALGSLMMMLGLTYVFWVL